MPYLVKSYKSYQGLQLVKIKHIKNPKALLTKTVKKPVKLAAKTVLKYRKLGYIFQRFQQA